MRSASPPSSTRSTSPAAPSSSASPSIATRRWKAKALASSGWLGTLRQLGHARRVGPVLSVVVALLITEWLATKDPAAVAVLGGFFGVFVLVAPALYRRTRGTPFVVFYFVVCAILVAVQCFVLPPLFGYESYVAHPPAAVAIAVLVMMAGWVLGRDIDLSDGLQKEQERAAVLSLAAEDARLIALRQQLDPHFLFNTLGAIAEWCREDPAVAERALLELSAMLRTLFEGVQQAWWPLERELELLRALQHLYALRDDERYAVDFDVDELPPMNIPPLIFLATFENALTHGSGEGAMEFRAAQTDEGITLSMWNPGAYGGPRDGGTGIDTTKRRLQLAYGDAAAFTVDSQPRGGVDGTSAAMSLPADGDK